MTKLSIIFVIMLVGARLTQGRPVIKVKERVGNNISTVTHDYTLSLILIKSKKLL